VAIFELKGRGMNQPSISALLSLVSEVKRLRSQRSKQYPGLHKYLEWLDMANDELLFLSGWLAASNVLSLSTQATNIPSTPCNHDMEMFTGGLRCRKCGMTQPVPNGPIVTCGDSGTACVG